MAFFSLKHPVKVKMATTTQPVLYEACEPIVNVKLDFIFDLFNG